MAKQKPIRQTTHNQVTKPQAQPQKTVNKAPVEPIAASKSPYLWMLLLGIFAIFLYANTSNFQYTFDDDIYTNQNEIARDVNKHTFENIFQKGSLLGFVFLRQNTGSYRPLTLYSFCKEKQWTDSWDAKNVGPKFSRPDISHKFNMFLNMLCTMFLFLLMYKLFGKKNLLLPILITLLFTAHPTHTEVIASVKSRDEVLALMFFLLSANFFWNYLEGKDKIFSVGLKGIPFPAVIQLVASIFCYLLSCLSKESGVTFVIFFPLMMWFFRSENEFSVAQIIKNGIPFVGVFFLFVIIRNNVLTQNDHAEMMMVNDSVLAVGTNYAPSASKWATHFGIFLKYISLLFYPVGLTYDYSFNQIPCLAWSDFKAIFSLLFHLGLIAASVWGLLKKQAWAFGIIFYLATFSIVSNTLIPIAATMAERFLFAPSLGFCIAIVIGLYTLLKKFEAIPTIPILATLFGIATLFYSFVVIQRNPVWESNKTLFESGVFTSPNSFRTHFNLAEIKRVEGEKTDKNKEGEKRKKLLSEATKYYENSLKIYPEYTLAWANLGMCYGNLEQPEKAREAYENGIKLVPKTPTDGNYANIANNLGSYHSTYSKDYKKAIEYFELSHKYNPYNSNLNAVVNLGIVNTLLANNVSKTGGDPRPLFQKSADWYEKAITINNNQAQKPWLESLVQLYTILGNTAKVQQYQRTLGAGPSK